MRHRKPRDSKSGLSLAYDLPYHTLHTRTYETGAPYSNTSQASNKPIYGRSEFTRIRVRVIGLHPLCAASAVPCAFCESFAESQVSRCFLLFSGGFPGSRSVTWSGSLGSHQTMARARKAYRAAIRRSVRSRSERSGHLKVCESSERICAGRFHQRRERGDTCVSRSGALTGGFFAGGLPPAACAQGNRETGGLSSHSVAQSPQVVDGCACEVFSRICHAACYATWRETGTGSKRRLRTWTR